MRFPHARTLAALLLAAALAVAGVAVAGCDPDEKKRDPVLGGELVAGGSYDPATHKGKVTVSTSGVRGAPRAGPRCRGWSRRPSNFAPTTSRSSA